MPNWIKKSLLVALVFGACWGAAVWYWRATNRMPSTEDVVLLLLVLPLALLLAYWLGARVLAMLTAAPAVAAAAPAPADAAAASMPALAAPLAILASALRVPHGATPQDLATALQEKIARAELDPELVDDQGFPLMTARSGDADDTGLRDEITAWLAENGMPELRPCAEQWRALVLGTAVAAELAAIASAELLPPDGTAPTLQLMPVLPADWPIEVRRAAGLWLQNVIIRSGWPAPQVALAAELPADAAVQGPISALARLAHHSVTGDGALIALLVACSSHLGEDSVEQWSGKGVLFTSGRPQGLIPGEGAAGLLLTDLARARAVEGAAIAMLHTVDEARRHNSADEAKRADATLLGTLTEKVLVRGAVQATDVAMIVADTGHRSSRVLELLGLASSALPQLDADVDVTCLGASGGTCGAVPFMTALALSHHHALERDASVLCISNEDPYRRCAALIRPAASLS